MNKNSEWNEQSGPYNAMPFDYWHDQHLHYVQCLASYEHLCSACRQPTAIDSRIGLVVKELEDGEARYLLCGGCNFVFLDETYRGPLPMWLALYRVFDPFFNYRVNCGCNAAKSIAMALRRMGAGL